MLKSNRAVLMVGASLATAMLLELRDKGFDVVEATSDEVEKALRQSEFPMVTFSDGQESRLKAVLHSPQPWYQRDRRGRPARY